MCLFTYWLREGQLIGRRDDSAHLARRSHLVQEDRRRVLITDVGRAGRLRARHAVDLARWNDRLVSFLLILLEVVLVVVVVLILVFVLVLLALVHLIIGLALIDIVIFYKFLYFFDFFGLRRDNIILKLFLIIVLRVIASIFNLHLVFIHNARLFFISIC